MAKRTWWMVLVALLAVAAPSAAGDLAAGPALTRDVPRIVLRTCSSVRNEAPLPLVCPPLVPVTRYRAFPGLHGAQLGTWFSNYEAPAKRFYLVGFNGGDSGPVFWHWSAGMGTPEAIRAAVLSDRFNEVKGKPRLVGMRRVDGRRVALWRFREHPAGGQFGGHVVAITRSGPYFAVATVHGYDTSAQSARMAVALARAADAARARRASTAFTADGVSFRYPRRWSVTGFSNTNRPRRLAVTSYRMPADAVEGDCGGHRVVEQLPATGVAVILLDYGSSESFAPRPRRLGLEGGLEHFECFGASTMFRFSVAGRDFQAHVAIGRRAPRASVVNALRVLETLTFARPGARG